MNRVARYCTASSPPRDKLYFWPAFVARKMTPRSRKSGYGLLFGRCRSQLAAGPFENTFFMTMFEKELAKTRAKIFTVCFGPASQSTGPGRLRREGALDVRESRERHATKSCQIFRPRKTAEKRNI